MIAFQGFKRALFGKSKHSERSPLKNNEATKVSNS
jgi:hypothetical protein